MKITLLLAFLSSQSFSNAACPFSKTTDEIPCDDQHQNLRRRRLASLSEDEGTKNKLADIIDKQKSRSLQTGGCFSEATYEGIRTNIAEMADAITNVADRGHFYGGIVRLAAVSYRFSCATKLQYVCRSTR